MMNTYEMAKVLVSDHQHDLRSDADRRRISRLVRRQRRHAARPPRAR